MLQIMVKNVADRMSGLQPKRDVNQPTAGFYAVNCNSKQGLSAWLRKVPELTYCCFIKLILSLPA